MSTRSKILVVHHHDTSEIGDTYHVEDIAETVKPVVEEDARVFVDVTDMPLSEMIAFIEGGPEAVARLVETKAKRLAEGREL